MDYRNKTLIRGESLYIKVKLYSENSVTGKLEPYDAQELTNILESTKNGELPLMVSEARLSDGKRIPLTIIQELDDGVAVDGELSLYSDVETWDFPGESFDVNIILKKQMDLGFRDGNDDVVMKDVKSATFNETFYLARSASRLEGTRVEVEPAPTPTPTPTGDGFHKFYVDVDINPLTILNKDKNNSLSSYGGDLYGYSPLRTGIDGNVIWDAFEIGKSIKDCLYELAKPCILNRFGTVDYYLNPDDITKKLDGTDSCLVDSESANNYDGQAMVELKRMWTKLDFYENSVRISFSDTEEAGYTCHAFARGDGTYADKIYVAMYPVSSDGVTFKSMPYAVPFYFKSVENNANTAMSSIPAALKDYGFMPESWTVRSYLSSLAFLAVRSADLGRTLACCPNLQPNENSVTGWGVDKGCIWGVPFDDNENNLSRVVFLWIEDFSGYTTPLVGLKNNNRTFTAKLEPPYDNTYPVNLGRYGAGNGGGNGFTTPCSLEAVLNLPENENVLFFRPSVNCNGDVRNGTNYISGKAVQPAWGSNGREIGTVDCCGEGMLGLYYYHSGATAGAAPNGQALIRMMCIPLQGDGNA